MDESRAVFEDCLYATIVKAGREVFCKEAIKNLVVRDEGGLKFIPLRDILNFIYPDQQLGIDDPLVQQILEGAAYHDLSSVCDSLLLYMKELGPSQSSMVVKLMENDNASSPLRIAVARGHRDIVRVLLQFQEGNIQGTCTAGCVSDTVISRLLILALQSNYLDIF